MTGLDENSGEAGVRPGQARDVSSDGGWCDGDGVKMVVRGYEFIG